MKAPDDVQEYIAYHGLEPMREDESEQDVRSRVASWLRDNGSIIEAHEVMRGARWDEPSRAGETVIDGLMGHVAQALGEGPPREPGWRGLDDEAVIGKLIRNPDPAEAALRQAFDLLGPAATLDLLDPRDK